MGFYVRGLKCQGKEEQGIWFNALDKLCFGQTNSIKEHGVLSHLCLLEERNIEKRWSHQKRDILVFLLVCTISSLSIWKLARAFLCKLSSHSFLCLLSFHLVFLIIDCPTPFFLPFPCLFWLPPLVHLSPIPPKPYYLLRHSLIFLFLSLQVSLSHPTSFRLQNNSSLCDTSSKIYFYIGGRHQCRKNAQRQYEQRTRPLEYSPHVPKPTHTL